MNNIDLEVCTLRLQSSINTIWKTIGDQFISSMEDGLTASQFIILNLLSKKDVSTMSALAEEMKVNSSAVTASIDRMVKNGFVTRKKDDNDRRVVLVCLTPKGKELFKKTDNTRVEIIQQYLNKLDPAEVNTLVNLLEKFASIVKNNN